MKPVIKIDIVSDVVCPWCYIGEARLTKAMNAVKEEFDFDITWHPFELNPYMPEEGRETSEYFAEKFGGEERMRQIFANTAATAHSEGLEFDLTKQKTAPNTFRSHRLMAWAGTMGKQPALMRALFRAYFFEEKNLGDILVLKDAAAVSGLDAEEANRILTGNGFTDVVSEAQIRWRKFGISSVPSYIIQNKYLVQGAQAPESFVEAFREIGFELKKAQGCEDSSCEI